MTKCEQIVEWIPDYADMPADDPHRARIDEHVRECGACREQLRIWQESTELIQSAEIMREAPVSAGTSISESVMRRIYAEERWRMPISMRLHEIPYRLRIRLLSLIAACLAMFGCGILYRLLPQSMPFRQEPGYRLVNVHTLGSAEMSDIAIVGLEGVPVASIGDPIILGLSVTESYPDYLLALSLIGLICALLTMNWLVRTRS